MGKVCPGAQVGWAGKISCPSRNIISQMLNDTNPYSPPVSDEIPGKLTDFQSGSSYELATRWQRFAGSFIDSMIMIATALPIYVAMLFGLELAEPGYIDRPETTMKGLIESFMVLIGMAIGFLLVNGYLLAKNGQTVGKLIVGTRIVGDRTGELMPLSRIFLLRYLLLWTLVLLPFGTLFSLADSLAIFRDNRKCLHDDFAHTKVVSRIPTRKQALPEKIEIASFPHA